MEWNKVDFELRTIANLTDEALAEYLANLESRSPELADTVFKFINTKTLQTSFLRTSTSEVYAPFDVKKGDQLGNWKIDTLIGTGGMGAVFKASRNDGIYDQTAALKVVNIQNQKMIERFNQERQRLAKLEHPSIVRIIDGGVSSDAIAYLVMDYVDGQPIDEYVNSNEVSQSDKISLLLEVAKAIDHAHKRFILHRDIKPSNVLITSENKVKLIDFGISSDIDEQNKPSFSMTFAYAAPEQLNQGLANVGTDIFAFGLLCHVILCGEPAARLSDGGVRISHQLIQDSELVAIISTMLKTSPEERFQSIEAAIENLQRFLHKQPVPVFSSKPLYKFKKLIQQYPIASIFAFGFVGALVAGLVSTNMALNTANEQRTTAEIALETANKERSRAESALKDAQWQFEQSEAMLLAANAYAEILYSQFSDSEKTKELTDLLMANWQSAFDNRAQDPDKAAAVSFALFRNFYIRRDYPNATKIIDAWMAKKFGPEVLVQSAEQLHAMYLFDTGQREKALPLLRQVLHDYESKHITSPLDKMAVANRIFHITGDAEDADSVEKYVFELLEIAKRPAQIVESYGTLGIVNERKGDFERAANFFAKSLEQFSLHPELILPARGLLRARLAKMQLIELKQTEQALQLSELVITQDVTDLGESAITSQGYWTYARALFALGRFIEAKEAFENEIVLLQKYQGLTEVPARTQLLLACIEAEMGNQQLARSTLENINGLHPSDYTMQNVAQLWISYVNTGDVLRIQDEVSQIVTADGIDSETRAFARWLQARIEVVN